MGASLTTPDRNEKISLLRAAVERSVTFSIRPKSAVRMLMRISLLAEGYRAMDERRAMKTLRRP